MKRILLVSALMMALLIPSRGQSLTDAYRFGDVDYTGSARTMALGGAMGAIGCDLGSIGINPAGSAVAGYSQFTITPNLSIAASQSAYALSANEAYGAAQSRNRTRFTIPNVGLSGRYDSEDDGAMRAFTFAFVLNSTYDYHSASSAGATNNLSSKFAEMASAASGFAHDFLGSSSFYNDSRYTNYWDAAMGYDVGLINSYGTGTDYVGCTEVLTDLGAHYVPGNLLQKSYRTTYGSKTDMLMNMGFNFNDNFFIGVNVGLPFVSYSSTEQFSEVSEVPEEFPVTFNYSNGTQESTCFSHATYQYDYLASGIGAYIKIGAIWLPFAGLRLGAAYQTPTSFDIQETWVHSGAVGFTNGTNYSGSGETGSYEYSYTSPQMVDLSLAYTFGYLGFLSVDYTLTDWKHITYADSYDGNTDWFDYTNTAMQAFSGVSHNLRAGIEINITPDFALRGGYSIKTCPEKYYTVDGKEFTFSDYNDDYYYGRKVLPGNAKYYNERTQSFSAGLGYNPAGSFFADLAVRYTKYPSSIYQPYYDYADLSAPRMLIKNGLWNAALTLGWRF